MAFLFAFALVIPIQAGNADGHLQCDPDREYPEAAPGEGEGCGNYLDCNENGVYDVGEPCEEGGQHDGPPPAGGECHCGHVFGENDQHGHCRDCDEAFRSPALVRRVPEGCLGLHGNDRESTNAHGRD